MSMKLTEAGPILITGATGYVGGLIAASLLTETTVPLVLLVRPGGQTSGDIAARLAGLTAGLGRPQDPTAVAARLRVLEFPAADRVADLARDLRPLGIQQIIHAAGCVDYFAEERLESGNIALTCRVVELAALLGRPRLVYISTAFSSGFIDGQIAEAPHKDPAGGDPTLYTASKRRAENLVMSAGVPWLIVRPAVLIGDSRTGRYDGKRYGMYQFWMGIERLLYDCRHEEMFVAAPLMPINFVHQDYFQNAMMMMLERDLTDRFVHLVSQDRDATPLVRDLWELWFSAVGRPRKVVYYEDVDAVPLADLHPRQRAFTIFAMVNMRIAAHPWIFEAKALEELRREGLEFRDATLESIGICQDRFLRNSANMQAYIDRYGNGSGAMAAAMSPVGVL